MMRARVPFAGCLLASPALGLAFPIPKWLDRDVLKRIDITGRRVLGFHAHEVSGDEEAFRSLTYYGRGGDRFTDTGQMTIVGRKVLGVFNFQMQLSDNRYGDPQAQRISIDYDRKGVSANIGDIRGSLLNTNQFATFNKNLKGVQVGYRSGGLSIKALRSEARNSAQTVSIQGNGSTGPYYLRTSQIVDGSVEVRVDGQPMVFGQDYTVNYQIGSITFTSRVVPQTSTIVATYEAFGFNGNRGTIQGAGLAYDMGRAGRIGVTAIEQASGGARGLATRTELYSGFGEQSTPYFLQFEPILEGKPSNIPDPRKRPVVRVDGLLQIEAVDYFFDPGNPVIFYFNRYMPPTSNIQVVYTPRPTSSTDGDRRVIGFDYTLPLGKDGKSGSIAYSQASGRLSNSLAPMSGTARGLSGRYRLGDLEFRASVRDVPRTYVSVESRGFNRNEKATDLAVEYSRRGLRYGLTHTNSSIFSRVGTGSSLEFENSRATTTRAYAALTRSDETGWTLEQARTTSLHQGQETRLDTTSLSTNRRFGRLNARLGLERLSGVGPVFDGLKTTRSHIGMETLRLNGDYSAGSAWLFGGRASVSNVRSGDKSGQGSDVALTAAYRPNGPLSIDASFAQSKAGELAALSRFSNGMGLGYGGNGFSAGSLGTGLTSGSGDFRLWQIAGVYRLTDRVTIDARALSARSTGAISANSETNAYGVGLGWDLGRSHQLHITLDQSRTSYFGDALNGALAGVRSETTSLDAFLAGAPGPWSYRVGASMLLSSGSSFAQDSLSLDANLRYRINPRSNLSFQFHTGSTKGYLPQNDTYAGLFYEHQLYLNVSLIASYKWRSVRNIDDNLFSGAYRSRGFDLELSFNFAP